MSRSSEVGIPRKSYIGLLNVKWSHRATKPTRTQASVRSRWQMLEEIVINWALDRRAKTEWIIRTCHGSSQSQKKQLPHSSIVSSRLATVTSSSSLAVRLMKMMFLLSSSTCMSAVSQASTFYTLVTNNDRPDARNNGQLAAFLVTKNIT